MLRRWLIAFLAVLALSVNVGCGAEPLPSSLTVSGAEPWQAEVVADAVDGWCRATGWCPELVAHGGAPLIFTADYPERKRVEFKPAYHRDGVLRFDLEHWQIGDVDWLWTIAAHELGHFGSKPHAKAYMSVLSGTLHEPTPACIDAAAVAQFCDESGQCLRREPTCQP